ncbi:MAG: CCC motif membrane protein [Capnocytophaga sp.]|nr:CCC motif membrane protein [Capnocytophaga sp.]
MEENNNFSLNFGNSEAKQKIETTTIIVLVVIGIVFSLCCAIGLIPAVIAVILVSNKMKAYQKNPSKYFGIENLKTAQILSYIALAINILVVIWIIYSLATTDWEQIQKIYLESYEQSEGVDF